MYAGDGFVISGNTPKNPGLAGFSTQTHLRPVGAKLRLFAYYAGLCLNAIKIFAMAHWMFVGAVPVPLAFFASSRPWAEISPSPRSGTTAIHSVTCLLFHPSFQETSNDLTC